MATHNTTTSPMHTPLIRASQFPMFPNFSFWPVHPALFDSLLYSQMIPQLSGLPAQSSQLLSIPDLSPVAGPKGGSTDLDRVSFPNPMSQIPTPISSRPDLSIPSSCNNSIETNQSLEAVATTLGRTEHGYRCIYCQKIYSRKYGLKIHLRTHTGFKPLKCKVCSRAFSDPSNLNKHTRLHLEQSSVKCQVCGKGLARGRDLDRHMQTRHPEVPLSPRKRPLTLLPTRSQSPVLKVLAMDKELTDLGKPNFYDSKDQADSPSLDEEKGLGSPLDKIAEKPTVSDGPDTTPKRSDLILHPSPASSPADMVPDSKTDEIDVVND